MSMPRRRLIELVATLLSSVFPGLANADTEVSYQGRLLDGLAGASGTYDLTFTLYDAAAAGSPVGTPICRDQVSVADGLFSVTLDFGVSPFDGQGLWLEIGVRADGTAGNCAAGPFTTLAPRQPLTAAPYAISAQTLQLPIDLVTSVSNSYAARIINTDIFGTALRLDGPNTSNTNAYTLWAQSDGIGGRAVLGFASDTSGGGAANYGVWGQAGGPSGRGVYGYATHTFGANYGVRGKTESASGWAGYFEGRGYFSGRLGIGTPGPGYPLHVSGSDQFMQRITSSNINGTWLDIQNTTAGGNVWSILSTGTANGELAGDLVIRNPTALALDIDSTGFVGFGDSSPAFRIELPNAADNSGRGRANSWTTYSSRRWKHNIETLENALDTLMKLRGVRYEWNAEHGGGPDIGFVAEEVGAVIPEIVSWEENGVDAAALAYDRLTALAVEAIKQQQVQIAAQAEQIRSQAAAIAKLSAEMAALRAALHVRGESPTLPTP